MAGINPFQAPINYAVEVQSPFEAALGGFKIGAAGAEAQAQAQARTQALKGQTELKTLLTNPNATAAECWIGRCKSILSQLRNRV